MIKLLKHSILSLAGVLAITALLFSIGYSCGITKERTKLVVADSVKTKPVDTSVAHTGHNPWKSEGQKGEWEVVPGKSLGHITFDMNKEQVKKLFKPQLVTEGDVSISDGVNKPGLSVVQEEFNLIGIIFGNDGKVDDIVVNTTNYIWHFPEGFMTGSPLKKLVEINAKPITFYGFNWVNNGLVLDYNGGTLAKYSSLMTMYLNNFTDDIPNELMGDAKVNTDTTNCNAYDIKVGRFVLHRRK